MSNNTSSNSSQIALNIKNRYVVKDLEKDQIGEGGIAIVYRALDKQENKLVAVKMLHSLMTHDPWIKNKFDEEAKAIIRIKHEGVVVGIEAGRLQDDRPYLVMEYIEGQSLRKPIKESSNGMGLARTANIIKKFGQALTAIHKCGVYHRDLKPENIMLISENNFEQVKVIDFGIATVKESPDEKTKATTHLAGTLSYMSPEQIYECKISASSDIYSMGVIAYEMVTRRLPFSVSEIYDISSYLKLYELQQKGVTMRPKQLRPDLPQEADDLIMQALEFDLSKRPATAEDFGNRFYEAINKKETPAPVPAPKPTTEITNTLQLSPRLKTYLIVLVAVLFSLVMATLIFLPVSTNFTYFVELEEFRDGRYQETFPITGLTVVVHNKDRVWFNLSSEKEGYVYLLNESPKPLENNTPMYNVLFPAEEEINLLSSYKETRLPKKDQAMEITDTIGVEKYWIIWAKEQIPTLESLRPLPNPKDEGVVRDLNKINTIKQLLEKYSSDKLVKIIEDKKTKKMLASSTKNIIVVSVELDHK